MRGYLGLGSNVGNRLDNLRAACAALAAQRGLEVVRTSSVYETAPQGEVLDQRDFLNACAEIETSLGPEELLAACKAVERDLGRAFGGVRHGPRLIDVDVLLLGDLRHSSERLEIPHPDLSTRRFVLEPLRELAPELVDADMARSVAEQPVQQIEGSLRGTWREAVEAYDLDALAAVLAPDAKLRSPITVRIPFEGRDTVLELMEEIFELLESMTVVRDIRQDGLQILEIDARLAGYDMHQVQVIELDDDQRVRQITLFMRPLPGVANLAAHIGPRLIRRRRGRALAALAAPVLHLAAALLKLSDRLGPRFV